MPLRVQPFCQPPISVKPSVPTKVRLSPHPLSDAAITRRSSMAVRNCRLRIKVLRTRENRTRIRRPKGQFYSISWVDGTNSCTRRWRTPMPFRETAHDTGWGGVGLKRPRPTLAPCLAIGRREARSPVAVPSPGRPGRHRGRRWGSPAFVRRAAVRLASLP